MNGPEHDVCSHLQPILRMLLSKAVVVGTSTTWSQVRLAITLSCGPTPDALRAMLDLPEVVEIWENHDTHYPIEYGVLCKVCKQSIGWPQPAQSRVEE